MADATASINTMPRRPVDYSGRTSGPLRLARAMTINIAGGTSIAMALAILWPTAPFTAVFMRECLGANKTLIGLNLTLVALATIASLPGAWLFSRLQRRRSTWLILTALARACMFGSAVVALYAGRPDRPLVLIWIFMICLFLVNAGSFFTSTGWWSWMADLIPESIRGMFFGRRYRWMLLGQSVVTIASGALLTYTVQPDSIRLAYFGIFMVMAFLAVLDPLLFIVVPEPVRPPPEPRTLRMIATQYLEPLRDQPFRRMVISAGIYNLFYNMPLVFLPLFLRGASAGSGRIGGQASLLLLSFVTVVYAVATAFGANQWGRLSDRIGHRIVWLLGSLGFLTHASYFFINETNYAWIALANAIVYGVLFAGQPVAVQNLALSMAPTPRREFYMSFYQTITSVAGAIGPFLGGWLADRYRVFPSLILPSGQPACYMHLILAITFVGMLLTVPLMSRIPDQVGREVRPWLGRLISGDLWRITWNISVLGTASSASSQTRALRRINATDGNLMLPEILGALDDSDPAIRREALLALGRLGTTEAMDLLRWYLHEPDAAVRAQSVAALAEAPTSERSDLLKRALRDSDGRVRRAAVEALGRSGDVWATADLRALLAHERDAEVLAAAANALSTLKESRAVREMVRLALHSDNPMVRSQMLVALADFVGGTEDFQRLWRQDRHWRGSGFARLARKLRRRARLVSRTDPGSVPKSGAERRRLIAEMDNQTERFLEQVEAEAWGEAMTTLKRLTFQALVLRYHYRGDEEHAQEFLAAVAPNQVERYWLIGYLCETQKANTAPEAPWDGLTLLALYLFVHG